MNDYEMNLYFEELTEQNREDEYDPETNDFRLYPHAWLGFPGMTSLEEVEVRDPAEEFGYVYVRPLGSDDEIKVHETRLFDNPRGTYTGPDENTVRV